MGEAHALLTSAHHSRSRKACICHFASSCASHTHTYTYTLALPRRNYKVHTMRTQFVIREGNVSHMSMEAFVHSLTNSSCGLIPYTIAAVSHAHGIGVLEIYRLLFIRFVCIFIEEFFSICLALFNFFFFILVFQFFLIFRTIPK